MIERSVGSHWEFVLEQKKQHTQNGKQLGFKTSTPMMLSMETSFTVIGMLFSVVPFFRFCSFFRVGKERGFANMRGDG